MKSSGSESSYEFLEIRIHDIQENWEMKKKIKINQKGPEVSTNYLQFSIFILKFNTGIRTHRQSTARNIEEKT